MGVFAHLLDKFLTLDLKSSLFCSHLIEFFVPLHPQTIDCVKLQAPVAELVDALDLGSSVSRRAGSSPVRRTEKVGIAQLVRVSP